MYQLLRKDILTQRKTAFIAPLFLIFYFLTMGKDVPQLGGYIYCLAIGFIAYFMTMLSNFNTNEGADTEHRLLLSMPASRSNIIAAKFFMITVWWGIAYVLSVVFIWVAGMFQEIGTVNLLSAPIAFVSLCAALLLASFFYPFMYQFGYRIASLIGIAVFFAIPSSIGFLIRSDVDLERIQFLTAHPMLALGIGTLLVVAVSFLFSFFIVNRKDY
ncbi:ABC-2 transporter permease [Sporolactobacillus nakayamae]|uniref:ABC-2 type transport system permease protein n=1 Tax=Sporolactobacillus nakayamae TaxID=269670 RepID=A0A1I2MQT1_9BACL|nr:ABC-2 transporter permease [Sporolactobacillus nakayamae]SFF93925.1 ABC-2 type transport system permease protein [Sporolactobacillus nakayamae]